MNYKVGGTGNNRKMRALKGIYFSKVTNEKMI